MQDWCIFQEMVDTCACPTIQLFLPLVLNIVSLIATADRHGLIIITEKEQDCKLDIHSYNNIFCLKISE
jgi:hypothetical protein